MTSTLSRFGAQSEKPVIKRESPVRYKKDGERVVVGFLSESNRGQAYFSPRTAEEHLYGQYNSDPESYAISTWIIDNILVEHDVLAIFIAETDMETLFEYEVSQFEEGYKHSFEINYENDEQMAVPIEYARKWNATDVVLQL